MRSVRSTTEHALDLARSDLAAFATLIYPGFKNARHVRYIADALQNLESGAIDRLMIAMPPRHGKSTIASWLFPAWYLGRHPEGSIIACSYGAELATDFGRRVRNSVTDSRYQRVFPHARVAVDSAAMHRFSTLMGGSYYAVGFGGPVIGRGGNLILVDDVIKNAAEASSATHRATLQSWYEQVLYSRLEPGGAIVLVSTRWHEDDLPGWLLKEHADEGWRVISLPALAEPDDPLGRAEGQALWPERYPLKALARTRQQIGGAAWASLYQQRPAAAEGAIFKRHWWGEYSEADLPPQMTTTISIDTAYKATSAADFSAAIVLGATKQAIYVLDVLRGKWEFPELRRRVENLAAQWAPHQIFVEDKASGTSLVQAFKQDSRLPVMPVKVTEDKVTRAHAVSGDVEAGLVKLPRAARWLRDFVEELSSFPHAPHDDQVDALVMGLAQLRLRPSTSWSMFSIDDMWAQMRESAERREIEREYGPLPPNYQALCHMTLQAWPGESEESRREREIEFLQNLSQAGADPVSRRVCLARVRELMRPPAVVPVERA